MNEISTFGFYNEAPKEGVLIVYIYINGEKLDEKYILTSVWTRLEVNKIGKAKVVFKELNSIKPNATTLSNDEIFSPGNSIRIETGYYKTNLEAPIFDGIIISQELDMDIHGESTINIECRDYLYPATMTPTTRIYTESTNNDIVRLIIDKYSPIEATIGATPTKYDNVTQYNLSDWDFMMNRAQLDGFFISTEGKKTTIDKPNVTAPIVYTFTMKDNILDIKAKLQATNQLSKVKVYAWNSKEQKLVSVDVNGDDITVNKQGETTSEDLAKKVGDSELTLQTSEYIDETTLAKWAAAKLVESTLQRVKGEVSCIGTPLIKAGSMVKIEEVNKYVNGEAYCSAVEHEIKNGNWKTTAFMGMETGSEKMGSSSNSSKVTANDISGLQIGKVTQIIEDPSKEYNIQVEIPLFKSTEVNKIWARLSTFWASKEYGSFFIPDIGDEVVLGFFDNDPGKPVIIGSLYSSNQSPSSEIVKENHIRSIVTKSKLKFQFDEDKKSITLQTPANNTVLLDDDGKNITIKDQNENKIVMNENGITIESAKSINMKAQTNITIEAGTEINLKGATKVLLQGSNIEAKADVSFVAKGSASAEISSAGQTIVKGSMVMIN